MIRKYNVLAAALFLVSCSRDAKNSGPIDLTSNDPKIQQRYEYALAKRGENVVAGCMKREGFSYTPRPASSVVYVFDLQGLSSSAFAKQFGFGIFVSPAGPPPEDRNFSLLREMTEADRKTYTSKLSMCTKKDMAPVEQLRDSIHEINDEINAAFKADRDVRKLQLSIADCVKSAIGVSISDRRDAFSYLMKLPDRSKAKQLEIPLAVTLDTCEKPYRNTLKSELDQVTKKFRSMASTSELTERYLKETDTKA